MDRVLRPVFVSLPGRCKARTVNLLRGSVFACVLVWVVALSLRDNVCTTLSSVVISFRGLHQKYQVRSGADLHKRLADVEARDPTVAQPMLAPSQFPLTHDFDRQTRAQVPSCALQIVPQGRLEQYRTGMCRTGSVSPSDAQIVCDGFLIEILEWNPVAKGRGPAVRVLSA